MSIIYNKAQLISTYLLYSYPYIPSYFANPDIYFGDIYTNLTENDSDYIFTNSTILEKMMVTYTLPVYVPRHYLAITPYQMITPTTHVIILL